jgi:2'-5' RNA ligase/GNAT superfamily N-acetyltransferase
VSRHRIGVVLLIPQPLATELDGLRRALGASERERVPMHLTLVSPTNLRERELADGIDGIRRVCAAAEPLELELGPATSFEPVTPTVHLAVGGPDAGALAALRAALVEGPPLDRPDEHEWVPHVTLAQELPSPARIHAAITALSSWKQVVTFDRVHVLREQADRVWVPIADATLGSPAVVGRGGLEIALSVTARPDPEAAALLAVEGSGATGGEGRPWAVTARVGERVVGAAWGWSSGSVAIVADLAVADAHRGHGIGRKVLAAVEAEAAVRGCDVALIAAAGEGAAASLLGGAGWQAAGDAVADGRRLWRREIA